MIYNRVEEVDFALADLPRVKPPQKVLMVLPDHFEVKYVINPHMQGNIGTIDKQGAMRQWHALKSAYTSLGIEHFSLPGEPGFPDMVFCANQTLPYSRPGTDEKGVILSNMHAEQRRGEVSFIADFFRQQSYHTQNIRTTRHSDFEGMGDAIWHPEHYLLWGGHGYRTDVEVYERIGEYLDVKVIVLKLDDPDFYHLDTCFSVLSPQAVMIYPGAFTKEGLDLIKHFFDVVIMCPEDESRELFACNAHCPDQQHVIIQRGCTTTNSLLRAAGFTPVEVDTSEFLKSGGSVFCMKQMFW